MYTGGQVLFKWNITYLQTRPSDFDYAQFDQSSSKSDDWFSCYFVYRETDRQTDIQTDISDHNTPSHFLWRYENVKK